MPLKSGKPKGDNDFTTMTAHFPTPSVFIQTNHRMSPILMSHPVEFDSSPLLLTKRKPVQAKSYPVDTVS